MFDASFCRAGPFGAGKFVDRIGLKFGRKMATAEARPVGAGFGRGTERPVHLARKAKGSGQAIHSYPTPIVEGNTRVYSTAASRWGS
jgi:hypothetical protein